MTVTRRTAASLFLNTPVLGDAPDVPKRNILAAGIVWLMLALLGLVVTFYLIDEERARDERQWQKQMQLSVHSIKTQMEQWVNAHQKVITELAENGSLQLYLADLLQPQASAAEAMIGPMPALTEDRLALATYLRNLLVSEAGQHGFAVLQPETVDANVKPALGGGIALFDAQGSLIVSTMSFPPLSALPADIQNHLFKVEKQPLTAFLFNDLPHTIFTAPVHGVQAEDTAAPIGYVVGLRPMEASFTSLLQPAAEASPTTETVVVRVAGERIEYISLLNDDTVPFALSVSKDDMASSTSVSVANPGLLMRGQDYAGNLVLSIAQPIVKTDWFVVHKVNESIALADTLLRRQTFILGYLVLLGIITGAWIAFSKHVTTARSKQLIEHYRQIAEGTHRERELQETLARRTEKYQQTLSEIVQTLVSLVDSRDPHAQGHSECVAYIAHEIAVEMQLSEDEIRATTLAGRLMNVGKIKAPESVLLDSSMSESNKQNVRDALRRSADILQNVTFDVPVVETLRQAQEHVDGNGPLGLKSPEILISAKIIAVVNAFVAMVSERPYRPALEPKDALDIIRKSIDTVYSYKVYMALENYLVHGGGLKAISLIRKKPSKHFTEV